jgi:hypothetical protein
LLYSVSVNVKPSTPNEWHVGLFDIGQLPEQNFHALLCKKLLVKRQIESGALFRSQSLADLAMPANKTAGAPARAARARHRDPAPVPALADGLILPLRRSLNGPGFPPLNLRKAVPGKS